MKVFVLGLAGLIALMALVITWRNVRAMLRDVDYRLPEGWRPVRDDRVAPR